MRSFIMTAAIAAALVSTSLTAGYAASSAKPGAKSGAPTTLSRSIVDTSTGMGSIVSDTSTGEPGKTVHESQGEADAVPPVTIFSQPSMYTPMFHRGARLSMIESELGQATHRINADRRRGELTPGEVRFVRNEEGSVRAEAIAVARANGGSIPQPSYAMLQDRVSDLNRTIHRYATNMARG